MKKLAVLFLAALLVVSMCFTTVEASNSEGAKLPQSASHLHDAPTCTHEDTASAEGFVGAQNAALFAAGSGNETNASARCVHSYRIAAYNSSQHKKICSKCGYTIWVSHAISYVCTGNTHVKRCSQCGYSAGSSQHVLKYSSPSTTTHKASCRYCTFTTTYAHNFKFTNTGNMHVKSCNQCGYSCGSEPHTLSYSYSDTATHTAKCKCGYSISASHSTQICAGEHDSSKHKCYCPVCDEYFYVNHSLKVDPLYTSLEHKLNCSCGYYRFEHHQLEMGISIGGVVYYKCTKCNYAN